MKRPIRYLNTDLDLEAPFDLTLLANAICESGVVALHVSRSGPTMWSARLEASSKFSSAEGTISTLLSAIELLDWSARHAWNACTHREFNVGYESGEEPLSLTDKLTPKTLVRIAALGATLGITIYAGEEKSGRP